MSRVLNIKVFRFHPEKDQRPYYDTFQVVEREFMSVLEALLEIQHEQDGSLAFRYACRGAVCGSCAMSVNGLVGLADRVQTRNLKANILVEPLSHLPVVKDLIVDMTFFWQHFQEIKPWLIPAETAPERERLMNPADTEKIESFASCILCGSCYTACPVTKRDRDFLGPALLAKIYRFLADPRDSRDAAFLAKLNSEQGVWGCDTIFNCVKVCPKQIRPTDAIVAARKLVVGRFFKLFGANRKREKAE
ncbi:MAG: succinate dehydrogenase iron-sulfur subunit [Candidatus Aminicenantes bacterium]|nr:succinate dehydrogenase iron-sulfur subunit [Candidatus Aminicenantes bacterium]